MKLKATLVLVLCVFLSANVVIAQEIVEIDPVLVECGDIIEAEFGSNYERHRYQINMEAGTRLNVSAVPLGDQLRLAIVLSSPTGLAFALSDSDGRIDDGLYYVLQMQSNPSVASGVLSASGVYTIGLNNHTWYYRLSDSGGAGVYTLFVGCTLRDGTVIEPGDSLPDEEPPNEDASLAPQPAAPEFSGYGFPGVQSRDFSEGIELPLTLGQPQTAPVASDVALYTYDASAEEVVTLNISRASGDLSIGVTVINKATNEIIFLGGLPSSNNLSVELTFPTDATYAIGLFRLDTAERSGTSGAVQISLE